MYCFVSGETARNLTQLNVSRSAITNLGIKRLCYGDDFYADMCYGDEYRCPNLNILEVSETRVTAEGKLDCIDENYNFLMKLRV